MERAPPSVGSFPDQGEHTMYEQRATHPWVAQASEAVRFAIVGAFIPDWEELRDFVVHAEELGFDAYWVNDHPTRSMDCWTTLAGLATVTTRIRLVSLVSCIYYRSPILLARQAADVDRLSNGRLVLGVGVGDDTDEFAQLGIAFPPARARQRALEETLEIVSGLWSGEPFSYAGEHFSLERTKVSPRPVQDPHIPVLIGGGGEKVTLRQVARYADIANFGPHEWVGSAFTLDDVTRKYEVLRGYCEEIGRPFDSILRSHWTPLLTLAPSASELEAKRSASRIPDAGLRTEPLFATPSQAIEHYQALADRGVQYFLATVNGRDEEPIRLLADEVLPALRPGGC
jgi:alkanesulfonate monooxygenase SsuD/methylene tetrahydromethanopterin reductase-like flavin-dependent oxidoreductase (luciferase family)